ncbi:MAG: iron ABC transporter permease, partial [Thermoguttaceae bacterium]|nr:iron ABC transporter permease [Thermoguttaceae bacterium]
LGVAGAAMQATLRNPLCSPFTLGTSSAAAFGAAAMVALAGARFAAFDVAVARVGIPCASISLGAFACCLAATGVILFLSGRTRIKAETILLVGVALNSFFSAGVMFLQYVADERQLATLVYWTFGDAARGTWPIVAVLGVVIPASGLWFWAQSWNFNALEFGEETARGLGVSARRVRCSTMVLASLTTAILVAALGIIGFVGLVAPRVARILVGADARRVVPASFLLGGVGLMAADLLARVVLAPRLTPVSIVTAMIGAPIFFAMLMKRSASE